MFWILKYFIHGLVFSNHQGAVLANQTLLQFSKSELLIGDVLAVVCSLS